MKVILKEDVSGVGLMGEIVTVKDGFARNYLIPKGLAVEANERNIRQLEHHKRVIAQKVKKLKNQAQSLAEKLSQSILEIKAKAGEGDKIFGSITTIDIEKALREKGFDIDRKRIVLDEPIRRLGEYTVRVRVHPEITADLTVQVLKAE
ncbi:MAG: 50S ribosomal protein L9 [Nitrospirae bacterium]|nr:MAG: 50S ribosomal protein L9 [Nitrospirota bacterium]